MDTGKTDFTKRVVVSPGSPMARLAAPLGHPAVEVEHASAD
jgi:hypothetical protein